MTSYEKFSHNLTLEVQILVRLWDKMFLAEIYRNIQKFAFKVLQECSSWASRNGAVQMCKVHNAKSKCKICKVRKIFSCAAGAYYVK